jgi:hypothetical protein
MPEPTHIADVLAALRFLDPDAQVTFSVKASDLRSALEAKVGGPDVLTAEQAAMHVGRTAEFWRRAAAAGRIDGAWKDERGGPWRLPRESCAAYLRALQRNGRRLTESTTCGTVEARGTRQRRAAPLIFDGGRARGPHKKNPDTPPAA